jgi:hypothetical protein
MLETKGVMSLWARVKPIAIAFGVGALVGPFVSNSMGWQVTGNTARAQAYSSLIEHHAMICDARARLEVKEPGKLDWDARSALAKRMAVLPGVPDPSWDQTQACARKLAA